MKVLQQRLQTFEQTNQSLAEEVSIQKIKIERLEEDLTKAKEEKEQIQLSYQSKIEVNYKKIFF